MPIQRGHDGNGPFYRYGLTGKRYYYESSNATSRARARARAALQGRAIEARRR